MRMMNSGIHGKPRIRRPSRRDETAEEVREIMCEIYKPRDGQIGEDKGMTEIT